ncbi:MAG TPA: tetratricopeptide repeat protein [Planctomycetota bacterium]|nr:tetratricopeptide repeat protein [Planctomycetota bacterium]
MRRVLLVALLAVPGCLERPDPQEPTPAPPAEDLKGDPLTTGRRLIDRREDDDNLDRAIRLLDAQAERNPGSVPLHLLAAEAYSRSLEALGDRKSEQRAHVRQMLAKAKPHADAALRLDPDNGAALYWRACLLLHEADVEKSLGRAREALAQLDRAESLLPAIDDGGPSRMKGRILQELPGLFGGSTSKAIAAYRKSLEIAPDCITTHLWLGEAYTDAGKTELARKELEGVLAAKPRPGHEKEDGDDRKEAEAKLKSLAR